MAVGDYLYSEFTGVLRPLVRRFGVPDPHSHFRLRPFKRWLLREGACLKGATVVEIGCGQGLNVFEMRKHSLGTREIVGFDMDEKSIATANRLKGTMAADDVSFHKRDCRTFDFPRGVDVVLLIDFLEHIESPQSFLADIAKMLTRNSTLIISVPTHRYPDVFGRAFHEEVGHVHDGFDREQVADMLRPIGMEIVHAEYSTGPIASLGCSVFYKWLVKSRRLRGLSGLALSALRWIDLGNSPNRSSSMFVVARTPTA